MRRDWRRAGSGRDRSHHRARGPHARPPSAPVAGGAGALPIPSRIRPAPHLRHDGDPGRVGAGRGHLLPAVPAAAGGAALALRLRRHRLPCEGRRPRARRDPEGARYPRGGGHRCGGRVHPAGRLLPGLLYARARRADRPRDLRPPGRGQPRRDAARLPFARRRAGRRPDPAAGGRIGCDGGDPRRPRLLLHRRRQRGGGKRPAPGRGLRGQAGADQARRVRRHVPPDPDGRGRDARRRGDPLCARHAGGGGPHRQPAFPHAAVAADAGGPGGADRRVDRPRGRRRGALPPAGPARGAGAGLPLPPAAPVHGVLRGDAPDGPG